MRKNCATGGIPPEGVVELQGDQREAVTEFLRAGGYRVVLAGRVNSRHLKLYASRAGQTTRLCFRRLQKRACLG
ncbi:MAG: translation initiation factor [Chloroflexi bacterium]|nr:translation initiation factor [Chloroflexota bacterium]